MTEPIVAITDYLLTLITLWFSFKIYQFQTNKKFIKSLWLILFLTISLSSLFGGIIHEFCANMTVSCKGFWTVVMLSIGITASSCWILGGCYIFNNRALSKWIVFIIFISLVYSIFIIFYSQNFAFAIYNYVPAIVFLFIANLVSFLKTKSTYCIWILMGILLSLLAAYIQHAAISIHLVYFNYNATYHLVQILALSILYKGLIQSLNSSEIK
ncbi:hypothetical protein BN59_03357 [Legionella massiliensis]|uniref:Uncharacterized protein n=1 Tax=Legionella massiliensis TaxID=1034943 RepID=A0A078L1G6_9GAMM|nr:hypothetical protein [Legionella massiliensis]CDZ79041.1 hypothetical protein BN59_03357 [Legionella massiliensis]CEE14779.1 hypothetical protein BN1094_03357 [Legionella massiliensis]